MVWAAADGDPKRGARAKLDHRDPVARTVDYLVVRTCRRATGDIQLRFPRRKVQVTGAVQRHHAPGGHPAHDARKGPEEFEKVGNSHLGIVRENMAIPHLLETAGATARHILRRGAGSGASALGEGLRRGDDRLAAARTSASREAGRFRGKGPRWWPISGGAGWRHLPRDIRPECREARIARQGEDRRACSRRSSPRTKLTTSSPFRRGTKGRTNVHQERQVDPPHGGRARDDRGPSRPGQVGGEGGAGPNYLRSSPMARRSYGLLTSALG